MRANQISTARSAERRHQMWLYFFYLSATILPGGALLVLLRWLWLRMHF